MMHRAIRPNCFQGRDIIPSLLQNGLIPYFGRKSLRFLRLCPLNEQSHLHWSEFKVRCWATRLHTHKQGKQQKRRANMHAQRTYSMRKVNITVSIA